jgi:hypothetical protein
MSLVQRAGKPPDANTMAAVVADTWQKVAARLAPVIGARGVDVLFRRALHETSSAYPWIRASADHDDAVAALASLRTRLANQEATVAAEASHALFVEFTELLATLIGESLTERLLGPVWAAPLDDASMGNRT